jgi:type II secretory pathway pseudopilin PulG
MERQAMLTRLDTPRREGAFTMVELVVGMLLVAVVAAAIVMGAASLFRGSSEARADRSSQRAEAEAFERFERDVRGAVSQDRIDSTLTRDEQRASVLWGRTRDGGGAVRSVSKSGDSCSSASRQSWQYCADEDVTVATANALWIRSDVDAQAVGTECVAWDITGNALRRRVFRNGLHCRSGDVGTLLSSQTMLQAPPNATLGAGTAASARFSYMLRHNPAGMATPNANVDPADCTTTNVAPGSAPAQRYRVFVTNVTLDLASWATNGGATAKQAAGSRVRAATSASIASRSNDDYAFATGCSQ